MNCNADYQHPCDADHGEPCPECRAWAADFRAEWEAIGRHETEVARTYAADMIDAGRGHLLSDKDRL